MKKDYKYSTLLIISLGIILRLSQYLYNRSLWLDEAHLANNIINLSYVELTNYIKGVYAPIGFLWTEKFFSQLLGHSEYSLRLFPLLSGILSLFLFYKLSKYFLNNKSALIALSLFVLTDSLIYYSSEVKQYSSDVLFFLIIYLTMIGYQRIKNKKMTSLFLPAIVGMLSVWFSQPAIFILSGLGLTFLLSAFIKRHLPQLKYYTFITSCWIISFLTYYFSFLRPSLTDKGLLDFWNYAFPPFLPISFNNLIWYKETFLALFSAKLLGLTFLWLGVPALFLGFFLLYHRKNEFLLLVLPITITFFASALHLYPFADRFILFLIPSFLIIISLGLERMVNFGRQSSRRSIKFAVIVILTLLLFHPILNASYYSFHPRTAEEIKPVLEYFQKNRQNEDIIYLYYGAIPAFDYYQNLAHLNSKYLRGIESRANPANYIIDLNQLMGNKRVWILFSHVYNWGRIDEEQFITNYLNQRGQLLKSLKTDGASLYLYEL